MDKITLHERHRIVRWWTECDVGDNLGTCAVMMIPVMVPSAIAAAIVDAVTDSAFWTWFAFGSVTVLPLVFFVLMYGVTWLSGVMSRNKLRVTSDGNIRRFQLDAIEKFNTLSPDSRNTVWPVIDGLLKTDDPEDADKIHTEFLTIFRMLENQEKLIKELSPNPTLEQATSIRQQVLAMNDELKKMTDQKGKLP